MKVVIVIPTYNEAENIGRMIDALELEFPKMSTHEFHILVVEGNSPDGTSDIVRQKSLTYANVHLLLEPKKRGLGAAYMFGFDHAMKDFSADVIVEMDADFQHDPKDIACLIAQIDAGYDYVIGSRFVKGGSIPSDWSFKRKFFSIGGNIFTRLVFWMWDVNDFTTGFKASRVDGFVDKLDLQKIMSGGFAYKMDFLYRMHKLKAKIKEIPIKFALRDRGDSKMEKDNWQDSLRVVFTLRYNENPSFYKFLAVGIGGLVTDLTLSNVLRIALPFSPNIPAVLAAFVAMCVTYYLNNFWSFRDMRIAETKKLVYSTVIYFASSSVPIIFRFFFIGLVFKSLVLHAELVQFIAYNLSLFVCIIFGLLWNYTVYSKFIWRKNNA